MEQVRVNHNQLKDQPVQGKPSWLRWLFPFFMIGGNIVVALMLLLMRGVGVIQIQQTFIPLIAVGSLLSTNATGTLWLIRALRLMNLTSGQKQGLTLALVLPVLSGMLALLPESGLSLPGMLYFSLAYFLAFAGVLEVIDREAAQKDEAECDARADSPVFSDESDEDQASQENAVDPEVIAEDVGETVENNEDLFAAILSRDQEDEETITEGERDENCSQWMNRSRNAEGAEIIEGGTLVEFAVNQNVSVAHIGLFPPVAGELHVDCAIQPEMGVRSRVLEARAYGISVEVKRTIDLQHELTIEMNYRISNQAFNEEVA